MTQIANTNNSMSVEIFTFIQIIRNGKNMLVRHSDDNDSDFVPVRLRAYYKLDQSRHYARRILRIYGYKARMIDGQLSMIVATDPRADLVNICRVAKCEMPVESFSIYHPIDYEWALRWITTRKDGSVNFGAMNRWWQVQGDPSEAIMKSKRSK